MLMLRARVDPRVLPVSSLRTGTVIIEKCKPKQGAEPSSLASMKPNCFLLNLLSLMHLPLNWMGSVRTVRDQIRIGNQN